MTITLTFTPEVGAGLLEQAEAAGLPLEQFLLQQLEMLVQGTAPTRFDADKWAQELDAWFATFPQRPVLSEDALNRENWYPDR